jgi:transposase-like protein
MQFSKEMLEEFSKKLTKAKSYEDLMGKDGVIKKLLGKSIEQLLEAEMDEHLGYTKHAPTGNNSGNSRNGYKKKRVQSEHGSVHISIPQDRNSSFEPLSVKKHQRRLGTLEDTIISLYAKGMSVSDIRRHIEEIYGAELSEASISAITGKVHEMVLEWQSRPLKPLYPIIFLDAIHYKVRHNGAVETKAAYTCYAIDFEGYRDVLGIWISESEGARYWGGILAELKSRGVEDILIASVDGLKGFTEAIEAVYPHTIIQQCIIHQIRSAFKYLSYKDRSVFMSDLKQVYQAASLSLAEENFEILQQKWQNRYSVVLSSWQKNWHYLTNYFQFSPAIRKMIYTTNCVENLHRQFRKVTKNKAVFTNDQALMKILFLTQKSLTDKWRHRADNWADIIAELTLHFGERVNQYLEFT